MRFNPMIVPVILVPLGLVVGWWCHVDALAMQQRVADSDEVSYRDWEGTWKTVEPLKRTPYRSWEARGGMYVELSLGYAGSDRVSGILVQYSAHKESRKLVAYDSKRDIAILRWDRWNADALNMADPDANEMLASHGFDCEASHVARLLRLVR